MPRLVAFAVIVGFTLLVAICFERRPEPANGVNGAAASPNATAPGPNLSAAFVSETKRAVPSAASLKAVYFASGADDRLDPSDLRRHPEVKVVRNFAELQEAVREGVSVWIDKNAASLVDRAWLEEPPQRDGPIVLIGYRDALYAFREALDAFGISGPRVDWSDAEVEGGFSVWMWTRYEAAAKSSWYRGYDGPASVDRISAVADTLLDGRMPAAASADGTAFNARQAVDAVLAERPEFPQAGKTKPISIITGGPAPGTRITGTLATAVERSSEPDTFIVTLKKQWNFSIGDNKLVGYWTYEVTPQQVQLMDEEDNTWLAGLVR